LQNKSNNTWKLENPKKINRNPMKLKDILLTKITNVIVGGRKTCKGYMNS
jgi:hypothetical protein